ncbi:MAG: response regulator [Thermodesulfobacteriota bacterium]
MTAVSPHLLIVEDSPEDYEATVRVLRRSGLRNAIYRCTDGEDALDFLYRRGRYTDAASSPRPGIILLDLNLPGTDGREVLEAVKGDKRLRRIPVVVLTTSGDDRDVRMCYDRGANSYIQKPVDLEGFVRAVTMVKDYWFEITVLPKGDRE